MDFQTTGTTTTALQACSPNALASGGSGPKALLCSVGGTPGVTAQLFTVNASSTRATVMASMVPGVKGWSAGNLVWPFVLPGAGVNANLTLVRVDACRRTAGGVAVATYGAQTFSISMSTSGTKILTVPVTLSVGSITDVLYLVLSIANAAGTAQGSRFTPNGLITTPIEAAISAAIEVVPAPLGLEMVGNVMISVGIDLRPAPVILDALGSPIVGAAIQIAPASMSLEAEAALPIGATIEMDLPALELEMGAEPEAPPEVAESEMRVTRLRGEVSGKFIAERFAIALDLPDVLPNALITNRVSDVEVETAWLVDVVESSETEVEERTVLRNRPIRTVRARWTGLDRVLAGKVLLNLTRQQHSRLPLPLYSDPTRLTSAYASGTTLACDTRWRRIYKGARVLIGEQNECLLENVEYAIVASTTEGSIELEDALVGAHPIGAVIMPCLDTEKKLSQSLSLVTDDKVDASLDFTEVTGSSALPASADATLDSIRVIHNGIPVWVFPNNWNASMSIPIQRHGEVVNLGRGKFVALRGRRPRFTYPIQFTWFDRESFWEILQFFDSRRGRARPFIIANPQTMYKLVSIDADWVEVEAEGNLEDHQEFFDKVILELEDGTVVIRDIDSIVDSSGTRTINFTAALEDVPDAADILRVTSGHLVRMVSDVMVETWFTEEHGETRIAVVDIPDEQSVIIPDLIDPSYYSIDINLPSLFFWADPNRNVSRGIGTFPDFERDGLIDGADEEKARFIDDARLNVPEYYSRSLVFPEPYLEPADVAANSPILIRPDKFKTNKGRDCTETLIGSNRWVMKYQENSKWWLDGSGLTLWWVGRLPVDEFVDVPFIWDDVFASTNGFMFSHDRVRIGSFNATYTSLARMSLKIYVMRWEPGVSIKVWRSGTLKFNSTTSIPSSISKGSILTQISSGQSTTADNNVGKDNKIGEHGYFSSALIFRSALTANEMNLVGDYLARLYPTFWNAVTV